MIDTIQTAGPYVLAFWFGVAFGFCGGHSGYQIVWDERVYEVLK